MRINVLFFEAYNTRYSWKQNQKNDEYQENYQGA